MFEVNYPIIVQLFWEKNSDKIQLILVRYVSNPIKQTEEVNFTF